MTIHFVGGNATQLESMFGDAYSGSDTFRNAMRETARTYKNIYVGSTLADLRGLPNFDEAGFNPTSKDITDKAAFGNPAGAETYFIGVTGREHTLKHSGQSFAGSSLLALVHEFLHPTQVTRELAETGKLETTHEVRTQIGQRPHFMELIVGRVRAIRWRRRAGPGAKRERVCSEQEVRHVVSRIFESAIGGIQNGWRRCEVIAAEISHAEATLEV